MRESAARIARMIAQEVVIMNKRKAYVEQMTTYLNDRIRELNKVGVCLCHTPCVCLASMNASPF